MFHCAGVTSVRPRDAERVFHVNVGGTKLVMEESLRAGVERVVHTSSAAVVGPAEPGKAADETQIFTAGRLGIPYVNSVHEAEVEAMRVAARGLPLVCVNPTIAFGAGRLHLTSTRLVRSFLLGRVPIYTDGAVKIVDVRDAAPGPPARGPPRRGGRALPARGPQLHLRAALRRPWPALGRGPRWRSRRAPPGGGAVLGAAGRRAWPLTPSEVRAAGNSWTYRSTKAQRVLGWRARPHEETLEATVAWHLEREHDRIARTRRSQQLQYRVAGRALGAAEGAAGVLRRGGSVQTLGLRPSILSGK